MENFIIAQRAGKMYENKKKENSDPKLVSTLFVPCT